MRQINYNTIDELSETARQKALETFRYAGVSDQWWSWLYEDAERAGIKMTDNFCIDTENSRVIVYSKRPETDYEMAERISKEEKYMEKYHAFKE